MEIDDVISSCASSTADSAPLDDKTGKKLKLNLSLKGLRHKREVCVSQKVPVPVCMKYLLC